MENKINCDIITFTFIETKGKSSPATFLELHKWTDNPNGK